MYYLAAKISSKTEDSGQEARIPAPDTGNRNTNQDVDAKKLAHAPPVHLESDHQATPRVGNPGDDDLNAMTSEEKAAAKKLAHAPPVHVEPDLQATPRVGNPGIDDLNAMTSEEREDAKKLAHAPPVHVEPDQAILRLGNSDNDDLNPMIHGNDAPYTSQLPPEPRDSDRANSEAVRMGGQDNDDGNTVTYGEEARSHGTTTDVFQVDARLVEDALQVNAVAVVAGCGGGNKKLRTYIVIGFLRFLSLLQSFLE